MNKNSVFTIGISIALATQVLWAGNGGDMERRVDSILSTMTLREKVGQMNQLNCWQIDDALLERVRNGEIGSFLNVGSIDDVNRLQKAALEGKHGIPLLIARDVIHGYHTIFPIPLGQAASFDPDVVETGARIAAVEATTDGGIKWTFAPMLDIARDPRWGRVAESLGEDPYLSATLGAAMVRGFQGDDAAAPESMAACAKHFAGYGAAEGGRDYNSTYIPPRQFNNVYLPSFQGAIDAGVMSVMSSFNANDGVPSTGNRELLREILRDRMGFEGVVVSDWNSVGELVDHGFAVDGKDAARLAAEAGLEMDMVSGLYDSKLTALVEDGVLDETIIDEAVRNILMMKMKLGLFDRPFINVPTQAISYSPVHLQAARDAAASSAILLKNDNAILPLDGSRKIAIIGPMADAPAYQLGTWVPDGNAFYTVTPVKALETMSEFSDISYKYDAILETPTNRDTDGFSRLDDIMSDCDVAVVFVGEEAWLSGEANSLSDISLIGYQSRLLEKVHSYGKPVVAVVMAGRPLAIARDMKNIDALVYMFHPGTMGGPAILDILMGHVNPSGKLPVTIVKETGQIPMYYSHENTGRPAPEDVKTIFDDNSDKVQTSAGFVSYYLDSGSQPLFPFGYGMSYSDFEISDPTLSNETLSAGDTLAVSVDVRNTGNVAGAEVVQLYVRNPVGSIVRPVKELKGFCKVYLQPGETRKITIELPVDKLSYVGINGKKELKSGIYSFGIGNSSKVAIDNTFRIK